MKRLNIWTIVALMGLMLAICTADGSNGEIGLRLCGVVSFCVGAKMAGRMRREKE
jgi:hypothetical protein